MPENELAQTDQVKLLQQQDQHQYEIARLNIEKNTENNAIWASYWLKMRIVSLCFLTLMLVAILVFCGFAIWHEHAEIAFRIIEGIIIFVAGNGTGMMIKTRISKNKEPH